MFNNWNKDQNNNITELINKFETAGNKSKDSVKVDFVHHYVPRAYHIAGIQ